VNIEFDPWFASIIGVASVVSVLIETACNAPIRRMKKIGWQQELICNLALRAPIIAMVVLTALVTGSGLAAWGGLIVGHQLSGLAKPWISKFSFVQSWTEAQTREQTFTPKRFA
jgi:hypothetical protein